LGPCRYESDAAGPDHPDSLHPSSHRGVSTSSSRWASPP